jgi:hypothetical protein
MASRDGTVCHQPKGGRQWESRVVTCKIMMEDGEGVKVRVLFIFDNDLMIAFEEAICLVGRQMKIILIVVNGCCGSFSKFLPITKIGIVRESKLSKTHESEETCE